MANSFSSLLRVASSALSQEKSSLDSRLGAGLVALLAARNGFYAFEGALQIFSTDPKIEQIDICAWNRPDGWRRHYSTVLGQSDICFAQDAFGCQFVSCQDEFFSFDPESGEKTFVADGVEGWCREVMREFQIWTGHPLASEWQRRHGPMPVNHRLCPIIPFIFGGAFSVENLHCLEMREMMEIRAEIFRQSRGLQDGERLEFCVDD